MERVSERRRDSQILDIIDSIWEMTTEFCGGW